MSSWDALSWAKKQHAGSPLAKGVLILVCSRADERFSCMPTVRDLADEIEASRSGVQAALAMLRRELTWTERVEGPDGAEVDVQRHRPPLLSTEEQWVPGSGAQDRNRYLINHPDAPHMTAPAPVDNRLVSAKGGPASGRGGPSQWAGGAQPVGGGGPASGPPGAQPVGGGGPASGPQKNGGGGGNTTTTAPDHHADALADVVVVEAKLCKIPLTRSVVRRECVALVRTGWTPATLGADLRARSWAGIQGGAVIAWLRDLATTAPPTPEPPRRPRVPWCGFCSHPERRTVVDPVTGNTTAEPCPACGGA